MDQSRPRRVLAIGAVLLLVVATMIAAWRLDVQQVDLVIVNASGVGAQLSWQPMLFAAYETVTVGGCESKSIVLRGGEGWRLTADGLDINANAVDRPWFTRMIAFEIRLDPGGSSRVAGPRAIDGPLGAPSPEAC